MTEEQQFTEKYNLNNKLSFVTLSLQNHFLILKQYKQQQQNDNFTEISFPNNFLSLIIQSNRINFLSENLIFCLQIQIIDVLIIIFGLSMSAKKEITLTWSGLSASIGDKILLDKCQGYCKPGEMLAIMGPSGAGKTTLLSLISQKGDPKLIVNGIVKANNQQFLPTQFSNFGAFVYQDDLLHQMLTVKETLLFTALLKYGNPAEALERVNNLIEEFELRKCEDTCIGGKIKKGISGGQKKRVCIAVEMVSKPFLMVLDEPTSGLDSHKAASVLKILKKLTVKQNCTIIFTIHQPSYLLYSQLTRLILLDKGLMIYQGDAQQITSYIGKLGISVPTHSTISDFFMMEISDYKAKRQQYVTPFNHKNYLEQLEPSVTKQLKKIQKRPSAYPLLEVATSFLFMLSVLFKREWTMLLRNPFKTFAALGNLMVGVILAGVFFVNEIISPQILQQEGKYLSYNQINYIFIGLQGVCFINITNCIFTGIFAVQLAFPTECAIYYKEVSSKKYFTSAYFLAKTSIQFVHISVFAILYGSCVYWMNGFDPDFLKFMRYLLTVILMGVAGNTIGFFIGSFFKDAGRAASLGPVALLPLMMFSGIYNKINDIPVWISWMQYISPFRYGLQMILVNQYEDLTIHIVSQNIDYNYKNTLSIESYGQSALLLTAVAAVFYFFTFLNLKNLASKISV